MYSSFVLGQGYADYGITIMSNALGYRNESTSTSTTCFQESTNEAEALSLALYHVAVLFHEGVMSAMLNTLNPYVDDGNGQYQFALTHIQIEINRRWNHYNILQRIKSECIAHYGGSQASLDVACCHFKNDHPNLTLLGWVTMTPGIWQ